MLDPDDVLKTFLEVTTIPGVSLQERQVIDYLKNLVGKLGFDFSEDTASEKIQGTAGNLICKIRRSDRTAPTYLLAAHVDTITPSTEHPVVVDSKVQSADDRILGADNRVGVTVLLKILENIAAGKIDYPNLDIVFLVAEEIGLQGSKHLDYSQITAREGFNIDCSAPVGHVVVQAPTVFDFELTVNGKQAHSAAAPAKGINAIRMASEMIQQWYETLPLNEIMFNVGQIQGGKGNNIVPGEVKITGEIRGFDDDEIENFLQRLASSSQSIAHGLHGALNFKSMLRYRKFQLAQDTSVFQISKAAIVASGLEFLPIKYLAGSDANIFNQRNIPSVNLGLGYTNNHSADEYIAVADLVKAAEMGARIVDTAAAFMPGR